MGTDVGPDAGTAARSSGSAPPLSRTGRPWRRRLIRVGGVLVVLVLVLYAAAAWYFSGVIGRSALRVAPPYEQPNVVVTGVGSSWVEMQRTRSMSEDLASSNVYGLWWATGFGWLRGVRGTEGGRVRRDLELLSGDMPTTGTVARVTRDAYPLDPGRLGRFVLHQVTYTSPAGTFPAYLTAGRSDTWAILVHGRGATRAEMFRLMRVTAGLGLPSLDIAYRHDPETGGGMASFGQEEWPDLQAAARWATRHGAHRLVLVGASMGGAVTAAFLEHSLLADKVVAVVLDAPMLDLEETIEHNAHSRSLPVLGLPIPGVLTSAAVRLASLRYGLDLVHVDYLDDTAWVTAPVLAFQGTGDPTVPPASLERFASAEPRLVTIVEVPGARHVEAWNVGPSSYERQVRQFLQSRVRSGTPGRAATRASYPGPPAVVR